MNTPLAAITPKLTSAEVCSILRYKSQRSLRNLAKRGRLTPIECNGRKLLYDPADVARFLEEGRNRRAVA